MMARDAPFGTYDASIEIMRSPQSQLSTPDQNNHHCIFQFVEATIDLYKTVTGIHDLAFIFYSSLGSKPITAANMKESHHKNGFE